MPTPNFQFKEPDDAIISPGPDQAQPPTNQEGTVCNFAPSPPPEQDSTPSARFALHLTSAQLAQFQSLSIHIPMSRMKSDKYNGTLSELFLAINHHFSYNIPSFEHLGTNPFSFTCVCDICNGPTNRQSTLRNSWHLDNSRWGHPQVLSIGEFNEKYVIEARDLEAAECILEQWIQRPPHGRLYKRHEVNQVPEFLPDTQKTSINPTPTKWYPRYQNTSESVLAVHTEHQLSYIHRLMDIIRELRDRSLSDYLFNMLSDNFLKTFKISNNITESAFP